MKVTVVTAAFNSAATIGFTLASFSAQSHRDAELLVIDGGSRDGTQDIVKACKDDRIKLFSEPDRGIYDGMNKGLDRASGDVVGFLNSDDAFASNDALIAITSTLAVADITYGHLDFVADHRGGRVTRRWRSTAYAPGAFARGWMPPHPTFYARRRVVDAVGRFDLSFRLAADYDWMLRAVELNKFRIAMTDSVLVRMQSGGASTSGPRSILTHNWEALRSRRNNLAAGWVDRAFLMKPLSKLPQLLSRS